MRHWILLAVAALCGSNLDRQDQASYRYRFDTEAIAVTSGEFGDLTDTSMTSDIVSVSTTDSGGIMLATVTVDSVWFRHTAGPDASPVAALLPSASGITWRARVAVGEPPAGPALTYITPPPAEISAAVIGTITYLFPVIRRIPSPGDHWSDTTKIGMATTVSAWSVANVRDGIIDATVLEKTVASATDIGGELASSESTTTREISSTRSGPVLQATIRRKTRVTGSIPGEPPMSVVKSSVTRIIRLPR